MEIKYLKVYVIIVTYNGMQWIDKCLNSIRQSTIPVHIIVIDNNSSDGTNKYILANYVEVEFIQSEINLGFGKGNNIGLRRAISDNADYVFLLNQDAWIEPNAIEELVKINIQYPYFGLLSPFHFDATSLNLDWFFVKMLNSDNCPNIISDRFTDQLGDFYQADFMHAAAWLISKDCLLTVGLFDPVYPHYGEDNDWVLRLHYWEYKLCIVPSSIFYHVGHFTGKDSNSHNEKLLFINDLSKVKNINSKFSTNLLVYMKNTFDELSSYLLYRRFKSFAVRSRVFFRVMINLKKIRQSRSKSFKKGAFIYE